MKKLKKRIITGQGYGIGRCTYGRQKYLQVFTVLYFSRASVEICTFFKILFLTSFSNNSVNQL